MRHLHTRLLLCYIALALLFTWPLARHFTTHLPGNGIDDPALGWNLWWIKARLVDQLNPDIFHVDWLFHPIQINLAFYTLTPLNGLISIPLQTALDLIVANNLVLLSSFVLSAYGVFLLVRDELSVMQQRGIVSSADFAPPAPDPSGRATRHPPPAPLYASLFAGIIYAFAANKLFYAALGQFNIASSQWIPFCVLYLLRMGRSPTWRLALRNAALAGLFLIFQTWAELTYASFLLLFIALYCCWLLVSRLRSPFTIYHLPLTIAPFLLIALIFLIGLTPFLWAMLPDLRSEGDFFTSGGGFSDTFSADLAGYFVPTRLHWLFGDWVSRLPFPNEVGQQVYIGYSILAIAFFGLIFAIRNSQLAGALWARNSQLFWLLTTLFFWWLTLGPRVRWLGQETAIPGPFALVSLLPFFNGNRYPSRYSVMVLLGVAVLVGIGYRVMGDWQRQRSPQRPLLFSTLIFGLLFCCFAAEHLSLPLPLNDFHVPEIYQKLAAVPGDFAILELPTGWRNGARVLGKSDKLIMMQQWYQTVHGKRRLGGNTSRNPPYKFQYFTEAPLLGDLIALMNALPQADPDTQRAEATIAQAVLPSLDEIIARNRQIAPQVLALLDVHYVTVHVEKAPPALLRFVQEALPVTLVETWQGRDWEGGPSTIQLYQVNPQPPPSAWTVDLATPAGNLYLGAGWSAISGSANEARYATRPQAELLLDLPSAGGTLTLELLPPATGADIILNGQRLSSNSPLTNATSQLEFAIPPSWANAPVDRLVLYFTGLAQPVTALAKSTQPLPIGTTGVVLPAHQALAVASAGKDVGDFAQIFVNGQNVALGQRGYNLVALPAAGLAQAGSGLASSVFDTLGSPELSVAMATWLRHWPPGTIIAGAVQDEASLNLGQEAVDALAGIGVVTDLRGKFRWSHAFIGAVGVPPGSALEQASLLQPATVYLGAPAEGPLVYAGVGQIQFTAVE